ncbi:hypothetical protein HYC85_029007 [Camellia sinensis]|uniref:Uncharacterized protein n=1 Tax=Camellia sinensis TaxID=4442 RepID=A0A7J7G0Q9_CAMSI|nr:hypothetical protein HYC85_029007 [Camellia sinensis]
MLRPGDRMVNRRSTGWLTGSPTPLRPRTSSNPSVQPVQTRHSPNPSHNLMNRLTGWSTGRATGRATDVPLSTVSAVKSGRIQVDGEMVPVSYIVQPSQKISHFLHRFVMLNSAIIAQSVYTFCS